MMVEILSENQHQLQIITLDKYFDFLKSNYHITNSELSFRNEIGRFYRIYGRENLQEKKRYTLNCINSLLKLFDKYSAIIEIELKYNAIKKRKKLLIKLMNIVQLEKLMRKNIKQTSKKLKNSLSKQMKLLTKQMQG